MESAFQKPLAGLPCISYNTVVDVDVICTLSINKLICNEYIIVKACTIAQCYIRIRHRVSGFLEEQCRVELISGGYECI